MTYNFAALSPADFEDLSRDLIGRDLGTRFEAFGPGPDGGIDGRYSAADAIVLQAKHFAGSTFSKLKSQMRTERRAIDRISASRYLLTTSRALSPDNKEELRSLGRY